MKAASDEMEVKHITALLRNVAVLVTSTGSPLYVLFVNQRLYALLDERDARRKPRL